jgi:hypothetical protein
MDLWYGPQCSGKRGTAQFSGYKELLPTALVDMRVKRTLAYPLALGTNVRVLGVSRNAPIWLSRGTGS